MALPTLTVDGQNRTYTDPTTGAKQSFAGEVSDAEGALASGPPGGTPTPPAPAPYKPPIDAQGNFTYGQPAPTSDAGYYPRYTDTGDGTIPAPAPQSVDEIQASKTKDAQDQINALNDYYASLTNDQNAINAKNDRSTSAISTLSGLAGSTEADVAQKDTTAKGQQANEKIQNEKAVAIQGILGKIRDDAVTEARQQRLDYNQSVTDSIANRAATKKAAVDNIVSLTAAGVTADGLKSTDPTSYAHLLAQYDGDENALKGAFILNTPQDQILDKQIQDGKYVVARQNPITGKITIETTDLGLPTGYSKTIDAGDRILAVPDNWDGDTSKLISINKGLTPTQQATAGADDDGQLYNGLSAHTSTAVRARVSKYATDNTIQNFSTVQDGYNFANSLDTNTKNPADDQALIYSLAKALDPGSVVREGEYATAQKYAQSWVTAYGTGVNQALLGTGFLSTTARENIKKTITEKYNSQKVSYDQTRKSYIEGINSLTGRADGEKFITEYQTPDTASGATGGKVLVKDGQSFDASALSEDEYQQALSDGYTAQ